MKVAIIIPCWGQLEYTKKCIESLYKYTDKKQFTPIVIDNASPDKTKKYLETVSQYAYANMKVIYNKENLGYVGAINQGIDLALSLPEKPDYILFANNDIEFSEHWLERMVEKIESHPSLGAMGPVSNAVAGLQHVQLNDRFGDGLHAPVKYLIGFFMMVKTSVVEEVGKLDDTYGKGFSDDLDYSIRMRLKGYKLGIARNVFIQHEGSASYKQLHKTPEEYEQDLQQKHNKLIEKWGTDIVSETMDIKKYQGTVSILGREIVPTEFLHSILNLLNYQDIFINVVNNKSNFDVASKNGTLKEAQGDWMLILDQEITFPPDFLDKLIKTDTDVVMVPFPKKNHAKKHGAIFVTRNALKKLPPNPFMRLEGENEDIAFLQICEQLGLKIKTYKYENGVKHYTSVSQLPIAPNSREEEHQVTLGIPCMEYVPWDFLFSSCALIANCKRNPRIVITKCLPIAEARNYISDNIAGDWLLFMDSDQVFPSDILERLLAHSKPIVSAVVHRKSPPYTPCFYVKAPNYTEEIPRFLPMTLWPTDQGLVSCDIVGTGAVLIWKGVFEKVAQPYFLYNELMGEDVYFFEHARVAGFPIFVDPSIPVGHLAFSSFGLHEYIKFNNEGFKKKLGKDLTPSFGMSYYLN